ncbi:YceD family protein [Desulfoplanes sp.]
MQTQWTALHDIPANGREFSFQDQDTWNALFDDYGLKCRSEKPVRVNFTIIPANDGISVQGTLHGTVILECGRCLEDAKVVLDEPFDFFEPLTTEDTASRNSLVREQGGVMEFDTIGLVWEQFLMALPDKVLCSPSCRGICPHCGQNLNTGTCTCPGESGDPRLNVLRNLKISKK